MEPSDLTRLDQEEGIRVSFSGKDIARAMARKVQPRTSRRLVKYSYGSEEEQARNQVIEGENLQAMVTSYRERGQVDLILTDPPYNTGNDFRYNDRLDEDPNDPELGELVSREDGAADTKWMRFMLPRLKVMRDMLKPTGVLAIASITASCSTLARCWMRKNSSVPTIGSRLSTGNDLQLVEMIKRASTPPPSTSSSSCCERQDPGENVLGTYGGNGRLIQEFR